MQGDSVGDKDAALILNDLAKVLRQFLSFSGRWDERVQLSTRAYEAMRVMQDWSKAGNRASDAALTYWYRARTNDAALWTDCCAEAWAHGGSKSEQAEAMHTRGLVAQQFKDYDEAERLYQEALATFRNVGPHMQRDVAPVLNDLGELAHMRRDYATADRYFREALGLLSEVSDKGNQAECMGNLGQLALDREQWAEARQWFGQALPLAQEVGRVEGIAEAQYGLARVHEAEGHADLALPLAQEALKIYERLQHKDLAAVRALVERLSADMKRKSG